MTIDVLVVSKSKCGRNDWNTDSNCEGVSFLVGDVVVVVVVIFWVNSLVVCCVGVSVVLPELFPEAEVERSDVSGKSPHNTDTEVTSSTIKRVVTKRDIFPLWEESLDLCRHCVFGPSSRSRVQLPTEHFTVPHTSILVTYIPSARPHWPTDP